MRLPVVKSVDNWITFDLQLKLLYECAVDPDIDRMKVAQESHKGVQNLTGFHIKELQEHV